MNRRLFAAALGAAALFAATASADDGRLTENLVPHPVELENPGFEEGAAGWDRLPRNAAIDASVAHGGAASASLTVEDPMTDPVYITRKIPAEGGAVYRASCFVKTENVTERKGKQDSIGAGMLVEWADRDGKWMFGGGESACERFGTRDWERVDCRYLRAPDGAGYALVYLALRGAGKAWFDDLTFTAMEATIDMKEPAADATIACNTPFFSWEGLRNSDVYTVEISPDKTFPANATQAHRVVSETTFRLKEPLAPGVWYWRVRAPGANHTAPRAFTQTAPKIRDCLPPEVRTNARRVLAADEPFSVLVYENGFKAPRVTFGGVEGKCGLRDTNGVRVVTFKAPAGGWAKGLTAGAVVATDAAGNVSSNAFWLLNAPKPSNDVVIDANGDYVQAGKKIFPIGIYAVKPEYFQEVRDSGFEVVHSYDWESSQDDAACRAWLDKCWAADGLRAFVGFDRGKSGKPGIVQKNLSHIAHRVGAIADHPGLFCWYLFDEPMHASQYVSPKRLTECADFIRALDPYHPVVVSAWGPQMSDYRRSWDTHWTQAYGNPAEVVKVLDGQRRYLEDGSPITMLAGCVDDQQTFAIRRYGTTPDPAKFSRDYDYLRACAFLSVVKRCNGLIWWWFARECPLYYTASQCPPAWANLVKVVKEIGAVRSLVTMPGEVETGTAVDGDAKVAWWRKTVKGRGVYLIAVNTGTGPATVTIGDRTLTFRRYEVKLVKSEKK